MSDIQPSVVLKCSAIAVQALETNRKYLSTRHPLGLKDRRTSGLINAN
jgi:hypothetical protein